MSSWSVALPWLCEYCGTVNNKDGHVDEECRSCGKPLGPNNFPPAGVDVTAWVKNLERRGERIRITKAEERRQAKGGAAWSCSSCAASNLPSDHPKYCGRCGAPRNAGAQRESSGRPPELSMPTTGRTQHRKPNPPSMPSADGWKRQSEGRQQRPSEKAKPRIKDVGESWQERQQRAERVQKVVMIALAAVVGVFAVVMLVLYFTTHTSPGHVSGKAWERTTYLDTCDWHSAGDWCDRVIEVSEHTGNGSCRGLDVTDRYRKKRGEAPKHSGHDETYTDRECTSSRVPNGTETKCTSNGNGSADCRTVQKYKTVQDCRNVTKTRRVACHHMRDVFDQWCEYREWDWRNTDKKVARGVGSPGDFPTFAPTRMQRTRQAADYDIVVTYTEDGLEETTTDDVNLQEYNSIHLDDPVTVEVNFFDVPLDVIYNPESP